MKEKDSCLILAIESSCDETAAAIIENGSIVRANVIASQSQVHERFGGVVPEVASRKHVESITQTIDQALKEAKVSVSDLSAVAVTQGPGLVGALIIGMVAAKSLSLAYDLPLINVHHIAGHIYANQLIEPLVYPLIALVVSGGHTEIVFMEKEGSFQIIGKTRDDAVGEAYDKVARALGLPYPGGPHVDRLAAEAKMAHPLPRAWLEAGSYDFSFSGLKSAVLNEINQSKMKGQAVDVAAIARGFQESAVEVVVTKAIRAAQQYGAKQLVVAGGVAANKGLRVQLQQQCTAHNLPWRIPPLALCTDNAAMIGAAAYIKWKSGQFADLEAQSLATMSLEAWSV